MANDVAKAFGGWKNVLEGIVAIRLASWVWNLIGGLNPLTVALLTAGAAYEKYRNFKDTGGNRANLLAGSPFWQASRSMCSGCTPELFGLGAPPGVVRSRAAAAASPHRHDERDDKPRPWGFDPSTIAANYAAGAAPESGFGLAPVGDNGTSRGLFSAA
jgi:hypothetical protein